MIVMAVMVNYVKGSETRIITHIVSATDLEDLFKRLPEIIRYDGWKAIEVTISQPK